MMDAPMLNSMTAVSMVEWLVLIGALLFGAAAHYVKKFSEATAQNVNFSVQSYFFQHRWAVVSSLMMQVAGLVYLVDSGQAGIFPAILLGISAESASGWVRAKSPVKA